ncbi:uncharacterized protein LOC130810012 [Amaranthus tricolor]|uniref:uncharacterized protein LOC130810012 n=1 Tax=Amaranthus tricolor TaxID=29722 RepID=UPI0025849D0A|nr:uncharacterized protein LOC130810012 [Amaranthus tricolor]
MGSCISKCKPKKTCKKQQNHQKCKCQCNENNNDIQPITPIKLGIQEKVVISQEPIISSPPKTSLSCKSSPLTIKTSYPPTSSSSISSSNSCNLSSSLVSSSSSILSSKSDDNQSFSNEFLWSCVKENPQLLKNEYFPIRVSNLRRTSLPVRSRLDPKFSPGRKPNQQSQRVVVRSTAQKRPRCSSPGNLTRQKSFRREPEFEPNNRPVSRSSRDFRPMSPSSSRRVSGEGRSVCSSSMRKDHGANVRPPSPRKNYNNNNNNNNMRRNGRSKNLMVKKEKEDVIKGVNSKIKELSMEDLCPNQDHMDLMPNEDANNPHIALDCFIFL